MKILAIVPDPATAYGLGEVLAALPRPSTRVVAFGQATAAALPAGLDVMVYPVREGTHLPSPFLDALVNHEWPSVLLAPAGAVRAAAVPTLLIDLDPAIPVADLTPLEDDGRSGWLEALTSGPDRRRELLRAGIFSVELNPEMMAAPRRVAAAAATVVLARLADMAALGGRGSAPAPARPTPADARVAPSAPPQAPPRAETTVAAAPSPSSQALAADSFRVLRAATPEPRDERLAEDPARFKGAAHGRRVLVLGALSGLDEVSISDLAHSTVVAVPEVLPWLSARMGVAQYVCAAGPPRTLEAAAATATTRGVLVHARRLDGAALAPRARACVPVLDLAQAGGPVLGWSDEMNVGFFPGPGDVALAVQWAAWLGPAEIAVAGLDPLEAKPHWPAFQRGAKELLESRGVKLVLVGREAPVALAAGLARPVGHGCGER